MTNTNPFTSLHQLAAARILLGESLKDLVSSKEAGGSPDLTQLIKNFAWSENLTHQLKSEFSNTDPEIAQACEKTRVLIKESLKEIIDARKVAMPPDLDLLTLNISISEAVIKNALKEIESKEKIN
jgi:hypothetical protein